MAILQIGGDYAQRFLYTVQQRANDRSLSKEQPLEWIVLDPDYTTRQQLEHFWNGRNRSCFVWELLKKEWPLPLPGLHIIDFPGVHCRLFLFFGSLEALSKLDTRAQVVYVDSKVIRTITEPLLAQLLRSMGHLCAPHAEILISDIPTEIKQHFLQQQLRQLGCRVESTAVHGSKRHALRAVYPERQNSRQGRSWPAARPIGTALVIGAGIVGASIARALADKGIFVEVIANGLPNHRHLGAALIPRFSFDDDRLARVSRAGILWARKAWKAYPEGVCHSQPALWMIKDPARAEQIGAQWQNLAWPTEWAEWCSIQSVAQKTQGRLHRPAIHWKQAFWVQPEGLTNHLLRHPNIRYHVSAIQLLRARSGGWEAISPTGHIWVADIGICANGSGILPLLQQSRLEVPHALQQAQTRWGDITYLTADAPLCSSWMIAGDHYLIPGTKEMVVTGSTFLEQADLESVMMRHVSNRDYLKAWWQGSSQTLVKIEGGWSGERIFSHHKLPLFGPWLDGLWLCTGFGTRGFSLAALYAEALVQSLSGGTLPLERSFIRTLA